ncbi:Retrovirus-related Pol poly from transposon, partial [Paramuricea clavata]
LFQYKRLNYGTNSAAEIFQNVLQQNLSDIRGVKNLVDDIIIHGKTRKSHDEALENCLKRLAALNFKVKGEKCEFLQDEITFFGLKFTAAGTKPDPESIENMVRVQAPKTAGEVRSLLGMANTCHEYIPDYATITAPLRELTKKNIAFKWENRHQKAFEQLKKKLTSTQVMAYFDTKKRSLVIVDGSPYGISAILAQKEHHSQQYKILSYASRALSPVETRYSQTDIEGLSLVWGIEHFRMFLIGSEFDVITDHKALESIFNNPRSRPPARIERWMMRLQPFNFKVIYRKGSLNEADNLSRHPAVIEREQITSTSAEGYVNYVTNCSVPKSMTLDEIKKATHNDPVLQKVKKCMKEGKWDENDPDLKPFRLCADELTYNASAGILLKNTRLVIPTPLQERATKLGHIGHQGIEKTKSLLREKIWYPNMDKRVKEMYPELHGQYLLVVIDTYSKFAEIEIVNSTEAKTCIPKLDTIFARYGIPSKIKTDNGPSEHYTVVQRKYNTIIAERDGKTVTRNVSHFKKVVMEESVEEQEDTAPGRSTETEEPPKQEPSVRRSTRMKRP